MSFASINVESLTPSHAIESQLTNVVLVLLLMQQPELNDDSAFKEPYPPSFDPLAQGDSALNVGVTGSGVHVGGVPSGRRHLTPDPERYKEVPKGSAAC